MANEAHMERLLGQLERDQRVLESLTADEQQQVTDYLYKVREIVRTVDYQEAEAAVLALGPNPMVAFRERYWRANP